MRDYVIDISTEVFHMVQERAPGYVSWGEEKYGPTQKIVVEEDVYTEFIDRAIAHRETLDQVIREACMRTSDQVVSGGNSVGNAGRAKNRR